MFIRSDSPDDTSRFGERIGELLRPGTVVSLVGELGAGKTWFTKGLVASANGYERDEVTSPAFSLINEYRVEHGPTVYHMDFYRLDDLDEHDFAMFDECFADTDAISIVEWGNKYLDRFGVEYLEVSIRGGDDDTRTISVDAPTNGRFDRILELTA